MDRSTADGLAGGGALLAAFSLILPWYTVEARGTSFGGESGWTALGELHWVVLALALAAGWSALRRVHAALPAVAAAGLLGLIALRFTVPPDPAAIALTDLDPFGRALVGSLVEQIGLELSPAYGIAVAAAGGALALWGALQRAS